MQELQFIIVEMKFDPLNVVAIVIDLKIGGQNSLDCDDGHVCYEINSMFSYLEKVQVCSLVQKWGVVYQLKLLEIF